MYSTHYVQYTLRNMVYTMSLCTLYIMYTVHYVIMYSIHYVWCTLCPYVQYKLCIAHIMYSTHYVLHGVCTCTCITLYMYCTCTINMYRKMIPRTDNRRRGLLVYSNPCSLQQTSCTISLKECYNMKPSFSVSTQSPTSGTSLSAWSGRRWITWSLVTWRQPTPLTLQVVIPVTGVLVRRVSGVDGLPIYVCGYNVNNFFYICSCSNGSSLAALAIHGGRRCARWRWVLGQLPSLPAGDTVDREIFVVKNISSVTCNDEN